MQVYNDEEVEKQLLAIKDLYSVQWIQLLYDLLNPNVAERPMANQLFEMCKTMKKGYK